MGDIIDFAMAKEEREPHSAGLARCLACKHEWQAVAPTGTTWLECPECSLFRGRFIGQHTRDTPHLHCECGNNLFSVTREGTYCPNCGAWQEL